MFGIRTTLKLGSTVFGLSAILLLALPSPFLDLLALDSESDALIWSMRMIGITLVALTGNMWMNSQQRDDAAVRRVGMVMAVCDGPWCTHLVDSRRCHVVHVCVCSSWIHIRCQLHCVSLAREILTHV